MGYIGCVITIFRVEELESALQTSNEEVKTKQRELTASREGTRSEDKQAMSAMEAERDAAIAERDAARLERDEAVKNSTELRTRMEDQERRIKADAVTKSRLLQTILNK